MNDRERTLEYDFRPRVDEATHDKIRYLAAREGLPPNVLIRQWILEAIRREEAINAELLQRGVRFHRVHPLRG